MKKELISLNDYSILKNSKCINQEVKRAALFSLLTGLRLIDLKSLTWNSIEKDSLKMKRDKIGVEIEIPLVEDALEILGAHKEDGLVFNLPIANRANKILSAWIKSAGIKKTIYWHSLRQSAVAIMSQLNVQTHSIAAILGHVNKVKYEGSDFKR